MHQIKALLVAGQQQLAVAKIKSLFEAHGTYAGVAEAEGVSRRTAIRWAVAAGLKGRLFRPPGGSDGRPPSTPAGPARSAPRARKPAGRPRSRGARRARPRGRQTAVP